MLGGLRVNYRMFISSMPRKRATRAQTTRPKPKLESLGDDIVNGMAPSERAAKLQSFIEEFDFKGTIYFQFRNLQFNEFIIESLRSITIVLKWSQYSAKPIKRYPIIIVYEERLLL